MKSLSIAALTVLSQVTIKGALVFLPPGQLERKLYMEVNGALENFGGKWNRKDQAHVFPEDPTDLLDEVVQTGGYVKQKTPAQQLGFFETPPELAKRLVEAAEIKTGDRVLEPSAGTGNLLRAMLASRDRCGDGIADISATIVEVDPRHEATLTALAQMFFSASLIMSNFLNPMTVKSAMMSPYDVVIMNPPFAKQADIDHVLHALTFLRPSGRLVAIMSASVLYRENSKAVKFRELVASKGGKFEALPDGSFLASGTGASTVMLRVTA